MKGIWNVVAALVMAALIAPTAAMAGEGGKAKAVAPEAKKADVVSSVAQARVDREALLKHYAGKNQKAWTVLVFPGYTRSDNSVDGLVDRYAIVMNYLSQEVGEPFLFLPDFKEGITAAIENERHSIVWVNPEQSLPAILFGYEPLVRQSEGIRPAVLTRRGEVKALSDLQGKRVGCVLKSNVCSLFRYALIDQSLHVDVRDVGEISQSQIGDLLRGKSLDAVVLRDTFVAANGCSRDKSCEPLLLDEKRYAAPGFFVLANDRVPKHIKEKIKEAFLRLNPARSERDLQIVSGLDVSSPSTMKFETAASSDLDVMRAVNKRVK